MINRIKARSWRFVVLCFGVGLINVAAASGASEQFELFAKTFSAATGTFAQAAVDEKGQLTRKQSGQFSFQRPGKFRWEVTEPHEQLIVSDGRHVFQYDPDLMQTTVRPVDASMGSSPAALLFGEKGLEHTFKLTSLPDADGLAWLRAVPNQPDSGLSQVDIGMQEGKPARLVLRDGFGQTTRIDLSRIRAQSSFPEGTFVFKSPPGVDVIRVP